MSYSPTKREDAGLPSLYLAAGTRFARTLWLTAAHVSGIKSDLGTFCVLSTAVAGLVLLLTQRPFPKHKFTKQEVVRLIGHSVLTFVSLLLVYVGLNGLGPARTLMLYEATLAAFPHMLRNLAKSEPLSGGVKRGMILFLLGLAFLMVLDELPHTSDPPSAWSMTTAMLCALAGGSVSVLAGNAGRKAAKEAGGGRRFHVQSMGLTAVLFLAWNMVYGLSESLGMYGSLHAAGLHITVAGIALGLEQVGELGLQGNTGHVGGRMEVLATVGCGALLAFLQDPAHPMGPTTLAGYALICLAMFGMAGSSLGSSTESSLPYYAKHLEAPALHGGDRWTLSHVLAVSSHVIRTIVSQPESINIFYFLLLNLTFTFVEFTYGVWTNSLGLMSDAFHMLFDSMALAVGLVAAYIGRWQANSVFTYGYGRVEVISGYVNGLFLVVIALSINVEAMRRLWEPPQVHTDRLFQVSLAGFLVNLVGVMALGHSHSHSGSSHGHSHGEDQCEDDEGAHNANMKGVFLHVLADTLGSVGVMISSVLIDKFGWRIADPICSMVISILIILSVIPLLTDMTNMLVQRCPSSVNAKLQRSLDKVATLDNVLRIGRVHCWQHTSSRLVVTVHVVVASSANEVQVLNQVTGVLTSLGAYTLTVQIEKENFEQLSRKMSAHAGGYMYVPTIPAYS